MSDRALVRLSRAAGLAVDWIDAHGRARTVAPDTLRTVLKSLGYPADTPAQISASLSELHEREARPQSFLVVRSGAPFAIGGEERLRLIAEDGRTLDLAAASNGRFRAPATPGYYRFALRHGEATLTVVPRRAFSPASLRERKLWGTAVQLYALRGHTAVDFGDFAALADFAARAAQSGAQAVAVSPVHAMFGARPSHISPYSPSTRLFLNPLYIAERPKGKPVGSDSLIDWPRAALRKMRALRQAFERSRSSGGTSAFTAFVRNPGEHLLSHARFEVLDARFHTQGKASWREWPAEWRDCGSTAVHALAPDDPEIAFQLYLQWRADLEMAGAQRAAISAGMEIGLIADMAVGVDPDGSLVWSSPEEMLHALNVGAPPDIFNTKGQDWGLTTFSPFGLRDSGYGGFIATLRAAMRHAGGMRLDHAMGLKRLWVVPRGAAPADGVYLDYPLQDLLGLIALESVRHRCLVIAEDLGTVPRGFRATMAESDLYGMRVLWFERDGRNAFLAPEAWDARAAALSTTHDLPTIAGWWSGRDIGWRRKLGATAAEARNASRERAADRKRLWRALKRARCAKGVLPSTGNPGAVIDAALAFLGETPCPLALIPIEDLIGEREQPNLPATIDEHPNWRRRLPAGDLLGKKKARTRAAILCESRAP